MEKSAAFVLADDYRDRTDYRSGRPGFLAGVNMQPNDPEPFFREKFPQQEFVIIVLIITALLVIAHFAG